MTLENVGGGWEPWAKRRLGTSGWCGAAGSRIAGAVRAMYPADMTTVV